MTASRSAGFYATIARYYDSEHHDKDEDLPLYSEVADEAGGSVLIIGSGTGRLMLHLAAEGHDVHGIEMESAMLDRARLKRDASPGLADRVTFHFADALDPKLKIDEKFSLIIIPYNTFMHFLTLETQLTLLKRAKSWLAEGGMIVIDLPNAGEAYSSLDSEAIILERTFLEHETGHLVMCTLHANSTNQALDRVINFFPEEKRQQLLMDLSLNLRAMVSQRLIAFKDRKGRIPAVEIMLNSPLISDLIFKGEVHEIKEVMKRSREQGMQTFDQALFDLHEQELISYEDALRNADSVNDLRLQIKLQSQRARSSDLSAGTEHMRVV